MGQFLKGYLELENPSWVWKFKLLSCVQHFVTPWTAACQAPLSMGFSGKNTGVSSHFLLQGMFPRIEPESSALAGRFFTTKPPGKPFIEVRYCKNLAVVTALLGVTS